MTAICPNQRSAATIVVIDRTPRDRVFDPAIDLGFLPSRAV
ncbi:hypothetical protein At12D1_11610 [Agrobacterium tumefaciens]|nr:hypothetical protein At12D1_11610 [Agrobacterium tumefaciens]